MKEIRVLRGTYASGNGIPQSLAMKRFVGDDMEAACTRLTSAAPGSGPMTWMAEITVCTLLDSSNFAKPSTSS